MELLVVVAIISILAALLMPALERALIEAQAVAAHSNMKQLGQASQSFLGEFDAWPAPLKCRTENVSAPADFGEIAVHADPATESRFADSWDAWGSAPGDPLIGVEGRTYGDELMDAGIVISIDLFNDPGVTQEIWEVGPYSPDLPEVYGKAEINYLPNAFLHLSSLDEKTAESISADAKKASLWRSRTSSNEGWNRLSPNKPSNAIWLGTAGFWTNMGPMVHTGNWESLNGTDRWGNGGKIFSYFDGHTAKLPKELWYSATLWSNWVNDTEIDHTQWDVLHDTPLGGSWNKMDSNHY